MGAPFVNSIQLDQLDSYFSLIVQGGQMGTASIAVRPKPLEQSVQIYERKTLDDWSWWELTEDAGHHGCKRVIHREMKQEPFWFSADRYSHEQGRCLDDGNMQFIVLRARPSDTGNTSEADGGRVAERFPLSGCDR
ncbi:hypothetical protein FRC18_006724 [Serendipita sp. 400]|nr:hypothetical protein FRC18_006724 [Serendipita sp. 400]